MDHVDDLMCIARDAALRGELGPSFANYCHQFRNRLNSIKLGIYLARRQATEELSTCWESLERDYLAIEDRLDRVQAVCRNADPARAAIDLNLLFDDRSRLWTEAMRQGAAELTFDPPPSGCPTRIDVERFGSGLDDLVHWRATARTGRREVRVAWDRQGGRTTVRWRELFGNSEPSAGEGTETRRTWTLPILARILADHHGSLSLAEGSDWDLTLEWPG